MDCPKCKKRSNWELQTHFLGGDIGGMCTDYYKLNEECIPLKGITMTMGRDNDWFIADCPKCHAWFDFGAEVKNGRIEKVFVI